jgi:hypothetical protein
MLPPGVRSDPRSNTGRTKGLTIERRIRNCACAGESGRCKALDHREAYSALSVSSQPSASSSFRPLPPLCSCHLSSSPQRHGGMKSRAQRRRLIGLATHEEANPLPVTARVALQPLAAMLVISKRRLQSSTRLFLPLIAAIRSASDSPPFPVSARSWLLVSQPAFRMQACFSAAGSSQPIWGSCPGNIQRGASQGSVQFLFWPKSPSRWLPSHWPTRCPGSRGRSWPGTRHSNLGSSELLRRRHHRQRA